MIDRARCFLIAILLYALHLPSFVSLTLSSFPLSSGPVLLYPVNLSLFVRSLRPQSEQWFGRLHKMNRFFTRLLQCTPSSDREFLNYFLLYSSPPLVPHHQHKLESLMMMVMMMTTTYKQQLARGIKLSLLPTHYNVFS